MIFYVDGACQGNGKTENKGGFGVVALDNSENLLYTYSKLSENTTNNREELKAILYVLLKYGKENDCPIVYSDSAYSINTYTDWMFRWAKAGWHKAKGDIPENLDIIKVFYDYWNKGYRIELRKVKGHAGHSWNEMADDLATGRIQPNA